MTGPMILGSNEGIAGMENLKNMEDVLAFTPWFRKHNWCDGTNFEALLVYACNADGLQFHLLAEGVETNEDNHIPDFRAIAEPVGVQLEQLSITIDGLLFEYKQQDQMGSTELIEYLHIS